MKRIALLATIASLVTVTASASVHGGGNPPPPRSITSDRGTALPQSVHGGGNPHPPGHLTAM